MHKSDSNFFIIVATESANEKRMKRNKGNHISIFFVFQFLWFFFRRKKCETDDVDAFAYLFNLNNNAI